MMRAMLALGIGALCLFAGTALIAAAERITRRFDPLPDVFSDMHLFAEPSPQDRDQHSAARL